MCLMPDAKQPESLNGDLAFRNAKHVRLRMKLRWKCNYEGRAQKYGPYFTKVAMCGYHDKWQ